MGARSRARLVCVLGVALLAGSAVASSALASSPGPAAAAGVDVYAHIGPDDVDPDLSGMHPYVYVPNEHGRSVTVIDAATLTVVDTIPVGGRPHHVTPDWDMSRLFVNDMGADRLDVIDPVSRTKVGRIATPAPYNLYFTPDGAKAIVIAEPLDRIDFYRRSDWHLLKSLPIPSDGVDHADFNAQGNKLVVTTEYGGWIFKINVRTMRIVNRLDVGGKPVDVKISSDGTVFYVANQGRHGVSIVDAATFKEVKFLRTGRGAHGLAVRRDGDGLYLANRKAGTISVIDFRTRSVVATWDVGGSPDMLNVSTDGTRLWASNRWHDTVSVIDTTDGHVVARIGTGNAPHGLTLFPQPGRFSLGHNGVYR